MTTRLTVTDMMGNVMWSIGARRDVAPGGVQITQYMPLDPLVGNVTPNEIPRAIARAVEAADMVGTVMVLRLTHRPMAVKVKIIGPAPYPVMGYGAFAHGLTARLTRGSEAPQSPDGREFDIDTRFVLLRDLDGNGDGWVVDIGNGDFEAVTLEPYTNG